MESIMISIVSLALIIISTVTMTMNTLSSATRLSESWKDMQARAVLLQRTAIVSVPPATYAGGSIPLTVKNEGQVNVSDFARWDVIVEDLVHGTRYLTYSSTYPPGDNQWAIQGMFISGTVPEAFDLGVLNPGEQMAIALAPNPEAPSDQPVKITVATGDGVTTQCFITGSTP
jgi:hypothetical protein